MEKPLERAWVDQKIEWGRVSGNHQGRVNSISQFDEDSDMVPACWFCWGWLSTGTMASASTSAWETGCPFSSLPDAKTIHFLPDVCGTFLAAAPVLGLRLSESE